MLKNVKKLLLVFVLVVQLISPAIAAHADEGIETADIIDDMTDQDALTDETELITPEIEIVETEVDLEEAMVTEIEVELDEEEANESDDVWTAEELMFFDELWSRFHHISNEAWDLFFHVEAMHLAGTLMAHPNGARLYQLLNEFNDAVDALATGTWIDTTLPFDHQLNVDYLNKLNTFITIFDYFVTEFTTALEVVRLEIAERDSDIDNDDSDNDEDTEVSEDNEGDEDSEMTDENDNSDTDNAPTGNTLPQTGVGVQLSTMVAGTGLVALGGLIVHRKIKRD